MEKLQEALSKARKAREGVDGPPATAPRRGGARVKPGMGACAEAWDRLTAFTPDDALLTRHRVLTRTARPEAAPFDTLRTKILLMMRQNGWRRLAITSPDQGCGKTTIAANLSLSYGRQRELRTMLLDLDLRRPSLSKILGHMTAHGNVDMLNGTVSPEEHLLRIGDNLAVGMQDKPIEDPMQTILSSGTGEVLDGLQQTYAPDLMIFDLSPMMVTDDARAILQHVDCALIVLRANKNRVDQLSACEAEVAEYTNVLGVVLNSCHHMPAGDGYDDYFNRDG